MLIKQKYLARPRPLSNIEAMKAIKAMKAVKKKPAANPRTMKPLKELKVMKPKKKTKKSRSGSSNWAAWRAKNQALAGPAQSHLDAEAAAKPAPAGPSQGHVDVEVAGRSSDEDLPATEKATQTPPWIRRLRRARNLDDLQYAGHDSYNLGRTLHVV